MDRLHLIPMFTLFSFIASFAFAQSTTIELRSGQGDFFTTDPIVTVRILDPGPPSSFFPAVIVPVTSLDSHPATASSKPISTDMDSPRPGQTVCEAEFRVSFTLPSSFTNPDLSLFLAADDSGIVSLNGNQIGVDPLGGSVVQIQTSDASLFQSGENILSFKIRNELNDQCPHFDLALIFFAEITFDPVVEVALDIKPQSCPNPLNVKSRGKLPAAILGSTDIDVSDIDRTSIRLEGVAPIRSAIEDVSTPIIGAEECDCTTDGADGFDDLTLKFDTQAIATAIAPVSHGDVVELTLTANLTDGTQIEGLDCVVIKGVNNPGQSPPNEVKNAARNFSVSQIYPNPFNPTANIKYTLPKASEVRIEIYNVLGERIALLLDEQQEAGHHLIQWDGKNDFGVQVATGTYFYRIQAGGFVKTQKMLLLR